MNPSFPEMRQLGFFIITYKTIIGKDGLFFLNFVLRLRIDSDYRIWTSGTML